MTRLLRYGTLCPDRCFGRGPEGVSMNITITFAEPITTLLGQEAERLQVSVEDLATKLLNEALLARANEQEIDSVALVDDNEAKTLEQIVTEIKALPPNPEAFQPAARAQDLAYIDYLLANPPQDTVTLEKWERFWPAFEQEVKRMDPLDDSAEGRL
jgi:hypothetical protein